MKERVGAGFAVEGLGHRRLRIREVGIIFRVLLQPLSGQGFQRVHRLAGGPFGLDGAKKTAHIRLGRIEHASA